MQRSGQIELIENKVNQITHIFDVKPLNIVINQLLCISIYSFVSLLMTKFQNFKSFKHPSFVCLLVVAESYGQ